MNALDALYSRPAVSRPQSGSREAAEDRRPSDSDKGFAAALDGEVRKTPDKPADPHAEDAVGSEEADVAASAERAETDDEADQAGTEMLSALLDPHLKSDETQTPAGKTDDAAKRADADTNAKARDENKAAADAAETIAAAAARPAAEPEATGGEKAQTAAKAASDGAALAANRQTLRSQASAPAISAAAGETTRVAPTLVRNETAKPAPRGAAAEAAGKLTPEGEAAAPDGERPAVRIDAPAGRGAVAMRGAEDIRMDGVRVMERRSLSGGVSANGEALTRALAGQAAAFSGQAGAESPAPIPTAGRAAPANPAYLARPGSSQPLHTLRLQLNPTSLGQVTATMKLTGGELSVELRVETAEAYRQLSDDSSAITKALRAQGYGVEHITIQHVPADRPTGGQGQQASAGAGQQFQFQEGQGQTSGGGSARNGEGRGASTGNGNQGGDGANDKTAASAASAVRADGVYL